MHRWFSRLRLVDCIAIAVPAGIVALFFVTYIVSPRTYLAYIINASDREHQAIEILTFVPALLAAFILFVCALLEWRNVRRAGGSWLPGGALLIGVVGLSALFLGGEEISWGQTFFHWKTPTEIKEVSRETNLHNGHLGVSIHALGNLFIVATFVALPIAWSLRHRLRPRLPEDWRASIAEWPVGACTLLAMSIRVPKQIYIATSTDVGRHASRFYVDYLEEISEQKEMLVAMALLMYALYRIYVVTRGHRFHAESYNDQAAPGNELPGATTQRDA